MSKGIPERIDLKRAARQNSHYAGSVDLAQMPRLSAGLADNEGQVDITLQLFVDEQQQAWLQGHASTRVHLICQRCLQPMQSSVEVSFSLLLLDSEQQLEELTDEIDAVVVDEVPAAVYSIIEDELILGLTAVPMHDREACTATAFMQDSRETGQDHAPTGNRNPFAVLKDMKLDG